MANEEGRCEDETIESSLMRPFLSELCKHVKLRGVITLFSAGYGPASWDVKKRLGGWAFGVREEHNWQFPIFLLNILRRDEVMAVVLRSYTEQNDPDTGSTIREVRGYRVWMSDSVCFEQIGAEEMVAMSNRDNLTGNALDPEPAVVYCGPTGDRLDGWLRPR